MKQAYFRFLLVVLALCGMGLPAYCDDQLDAQLNALVEKYGADSVARALQRKNPGAVESAKNTDVGKGAVSPEPEKKDNGFYGFLIRKSYSDVTSDEDPTVASPRASYEKADPAMFSYTHDYQAHSDAWAAIGTLLRPFQVQLDGAPSSDNMVLDKISFVPSITLDRETNNKDATKNVDSIIARAGLFGEIAGGPRPLRLMDFRLYATYATNSRFKGGIVAGEFDWEPTTSIPGNRTFYRLARNGSGEKGRPGSLVELHWRLFVHSEFGTNVDGNLAANQSDNFFRVGPVFGLKLDPFFLPRLSASVDYSYLAGVSGKPSDSHNLSSTLSYILDKDPETQHWTINATYEDGDTPLVKQKVQTLLLSLGVKY